MKSSNPFSQNKVRRFHQASNRRSRQKSCHHLDQFCFQIVQLFAARRTAAAEAARMAAVRAAGLASGGGGLKDGGD
ncbi:MAG: hypothetical protein ACKPKO_21405, partial [Candidatus Fonsibacter sp.]